MIDKLNLNSQNPFAIVDDFSVFLNYLEENNIKLTKINQFLQGKVIYALNQKMTLEKMGNVTTRTPQKSYPLIHLFYHLTLSSKLFEVNYRKSYNLLEPTEYLGIFRNLTKTEKFVFLLETLWLDCDWKKLQVGRFEYRCEDNLEQTLAVLLKHGPDKYVKVTTGTSLKGLTFSLEYFLKYISYFGLWRVKYYESTHKRSKRAYKADGITLTKLGAQICPILLQHWPLEEYNLPYMRHMGIDLGILGERTPFEKPFWKSFIDIFPENELSGTIPREVDNKYKIEGNFIFKVSLQSSWRKIKISSSSSLDDLHLIIQEAFKFNNDHLYAFFPSGRAWKGESYTSSFSDGLNAADKKITNLGIHPGQEILYIFDFGDEWRLRVKFEELIEEPQLLKPQIIDKKGKDPEQYEW